MKKYECGACGYIYDPAVGDPDGGIAPGTAFEDIPDDWVCPICGLGKDVFVPVEDSTENADARLTDTKRYQENILKKWRPDYD